jgi:hypothetical protein
MVGTRPDAVPHEVGAARMQALLSAWEHIRVPLKAQALSTPPGIRSSIAAVGGARRLIAGSVLVSGQDVSPLFRLSNSTRRSEPAFMDIERLMACCPMEIVPPTAGDSSRNSLRGTKR